MKRTPGSSLVLLIAATLLLIGGGAVAATWSSSPGMMAELQKVNDRVGSPASATPSASRASEPSPSIPAPIPAPIPSASADAAAPTAPIPAVSPRVKEKPPITYVVKPGDTLSDIAAWFWLHGYGKLYEANRAVIGVDANLIFPGERITISGGHMAVQPTS